ncbi:MAG: DUF1559 domain-containing protein [Mariniblastus sp.]
MDNNRFENQFANASGNRQGFTWIELVIVIVIIGVLIGMLLPAVGRTRNVSRRAICMNQARQVALAMHVFESAHKEFPSAMGDQRLVNAAGHGNANRLSGMMLLLPYLEENQLWESISKPSTFEGIDYPAMGTAPWDSRFVPWREQISIFKCPSAPNVETEFGRTSYAFCIGDVARDIHQPTNLRGAFGCGLNSTFGDFTDGTSNTILIAEMGLGGNRSVIGNFAVRQPTKMLDDPSQCFSLIDSADEALFDKQISLGSLGRGGCWADGAAGCSLVNTILPPNSPSVSISKDQFGDGIYSAGGYHVGGIVIALADGSGHFVSENIDAGRPIGTLLTAEQMSAGEPSPFGVWGALGTLGGDEEYSANDL